ncbi:MAG: TPM domain-containing protein [Phycisphaerae bacterium]|nr:TPM domain-containing protein [Phycisphaerae bacterium]
MHELPTSLTRHDRLHVALVTIVTLLSVTAPLRAQPASTPRTGVIDQAGIIDAQTTNALNAILLELEQRNLAQMRIVTIRSTNGRDLHEFAMELAREWKLGDATKHNGILMIIAHSDRKYRTITGQGIEGALPDLFLDRVQNECFLPNFRKGNFSAGIYLATVAIANQVATEAGTTLSGMPATPPAVKSRTGEDRPGDGGASCFFMFIIVLVLVSSLSRSSRRGIRGSSGLGNLVAGMMLGRMLGGGGWGSSHRGGSFGGGGFGGGGGGSFGGGGSGGSW